MAEKKLLKLSDWSKGMVTAASRTDLPPDALFYAENVDLSIPYRQGLIEQDAFLGDVSGDPNPNHNAAAGNDALMGWKIFTDDNFGTGTRFGAVQFAGAEYFWKYYSDNLYFAAKASTDWTAPALGGSAVDPLKDIFDTGKNLIVPLAAETGNNWLAAIWDHEPTSLTVGNEVINVDLDWDAAGAGEGAQVWIAFDDCAEWHAFQCVKPHQSTTDATDDTYPPHNREALNPPVDIENWSGFPWMEYWLWMGMAASEASIFTKFTFDAGDEWSGAGVSYTAPKLELVITKATTGAAISPLSALPAEYIGHTLSDASRLTAVSWDGTADISIRPPQPAAANTADWPAIDTTTTTIPVDNGLMAGADGVTAPDQVAYAFYVNAYRLTCARTPEETQPRYWDRSIFFEAPKWEAHTRLEYYIVYEHDHGGFSKPKLLFTAEVDSAEARHQAIGLQFWANLGKWSESVRRVHIFRVMGDDAGGERQDSLLFTVDRETSNWIKTGATSDYMYYHGEAEFTSPMATITTYAYGGGPLKAKGIRPGNRWRYQIDGDMGAEYNADPARANCRQASAISYAFIRAAELGASLAPDVKGGVGLFSFVDYGQPRTEDARTILGASITDLMGVTAVAYETLDLVGTALGRAFYTDSTSGTVYYSEIERYSIVDPLNYLAFKNSGILQTVENLHGYLVLLFEHKTVILDARSGLDTAWSVVQEMNGVGCAGRDCVARHESMIFWAGSGGVWMWDGAGSPERISLPIEYSALSADMHYKASQIWLAFDPDKSDLLLYLYAATYSDGWGDLYFEDQLQHESIGRRGKCLVYNIANKAWTTETFRSFRVEAVDNTYYYRFLGKPFVMDNFLLIPTSDISHASYSYLIVRQAYSQFLYDTINHDTEIPPWKRAVIETGYLDCGNQAADKKLKRLHAAFGPPMLGGEVASASADYLDNWSIELHAFQGWEDVMGTSPWYTMADRTADYTWDVAAEDNEAGDGTIGYHRSIYTKNNLPSRQFRYMALWAESQGTDGTPPFETNITKSELGTLAISFIEKSKV